GRRVLHIETTRQPTQLAGDKFWANDDFAAADRQYDAAFKAEPRAWVRRELLAARVRCLREQGELAAAGRVFRQLLESDPDTPFFDVIPLAWLSTAPNADAQALAESWLGDAQSKTARLMAASWLVGTQRDAEAVATLSSLAKDADQRLAFLATTQTWRARLAA